MTNERKELYDFLIGLGYTPDEAWEEISNYDLAEDYEEE